MLIKQPVLDSLISALDIKASGQEEDSFWIACDGPVDLEQLQEEVEVERVEMVPKVAVMMFQHKGMDELAEQVPLDCQLVEMTRVGDAYFLGAPAEVELSVDGCRVLGKISSLPCEREKAKLCRLESRARARGKGKEAARDASSRKCSENSLEDHSFPSELSNEQVRILPVKAQAYAEQVQRVLAKRGIRVVVVAGGPLSRRVFESQRDEVPFTIVVGPKEEASRQVTIRAGGGTGVETLTLDQWVVELGQTDK